MTVCACSLYLLNVCRCMTTCFFNSRLCTLLSQFRLFQCVIDENLSPSALKSGFVRVKFRFIKHTMQYCKCYYLTAKTNQIIRISVALCAEIRLYGIFVVLLQRIIVSVMYFFTEIRTHKIVPFAVGNAQFQFLGIRARIDCYLLSR